MPVRTASGKAQLILKGCFIISDTFFNSFKTLTCNKLGNLAYLVGSAPGFNLVVRVSY